MCLVKYEDYEEIFTRRWIALEWILLVEKTDMIGCDVETIQLL